MRNTTGAAIAVMCLLTGWGVSSLRSHSPLKPIVTVQTVESVETLTTPERQPAAVKNAELITPAEALPASPFQYQSELVSYAELKTKVLPNEGEKAARRMLISNPQLLKAMAARLVQQPLLSLREQAAAVDLLVDALGAGDKLVAEEALMSVVLDKQVEDTSLPRAVRDQMAGIKAEVLYYWAAHRPHQSGQLQAALPGPVSQKIWNNVMASHQSNTAESQAEASSR